MVLDTSLFVDSKTPLYVYDTELLDRTVEILDRESSRVAVSVNYALKANFDEKIVKTMSLAGFGADCVSGNEVRLALRCGFNASDIFFAGVGKTDDEIGLAVRAKIGALVVESLQELEVIGEIAAREGAAASVMLRVNPNVDAHTHRFIRTGTSNDKFGLDWNDVPAALETIAATPQLHFCGLHLHVGSQITDFDVFAKECQKMNSLVEMVENAGFPVEHISLGGGLGIDYEDPDTHPVADFAAWMSVIEANLHRRPEQKVHVEPGRSLVAQCGTLVSRVLYVKENPACNFLILDAGMNDLIRPALYGARHRIENLSARERGEQAEMQYKVVGPVCESSDVFASACVLPKSRRGDIVAIRSAGAYGATMSNRYNLKEIAETLYV